MAFGTLLQVTPVASAAVWLGLTAYLVARDRYRTWTEVFLLAMCFFLGAYPLSDLAFLNAPTVETGEITARVSFTFLSLAATFFLLFAIVLHGRMRRGLFLVLVPTVGALFLVWSRLVPGVASAADVGLPYRAEYDPTWLAVWSVYAAGYILVGIAVLGLTYVELRRHASVLARRMGLLLFAIVLTLLGAASNLVVALLGVHAPPLFSSLLAIPGLVAFVGLSPVREAGMVRSLHRWKASDCEVEAAFITYLDGSLLGVHARPGELGVDGDLFASTLDVIQNFMRTSFPFLRGKSLSSITQGDHTLVLERGRVTYLTVVLRGLENDQLRRLMRDTVRTYEEANAAAFAHWHGDPADAEGTEAMLASFLEA